MMDLFDMIRVSLLEKESVLFARRNKAIANNITDISTLSGKQVGVSLRTELSSADFSPRQVQDICKKSNSLKPNRPLITRIEKALSPAMSHGLARRWRLTFHFMTGGQSVPGDTASVSGHKHANIVYEAGAEEHA